MQNKNNGGPAFPFNRAEAECYAGMSLRDYFATHATVDDYWPYMKRHGDVVVDKKGERVIAKYKYADAMLEARDENSK